MKPVALITGGSKGIGFGIAKALANQQFDLAINGIRPETSVTQSIDELQALGADVIYCQGDITKNTNRVKILEKIEQYFGRLNVLVNNAGTAPQHRKDLLDTPEESFDLVMDTNLKGPFFLSQQVAKWMIAQKDKEKDFSACIINISSISAEVASISRGEYCMSKAAMTMMTKLFAVRLSEAELPVYEIQPGIIDTDMTATVKDKYNKVIAEGAPLQQRWGKPEDIGSAVAMLARGELSFSTGQIIKVDGGLCVARL